MSKNSFLSFHCLPKSAVKTLGFLEFCERFESTYFLLNSHHLYGRLCLYLAKQASQQNISLSFNFLERTEEKAPARAFL